MRRVSALVTTLIMVGVTSQPMGQSRSESEGANRVVGMWRLVSIVQEGEQAPNRGPRPTGLIVYDASGQMSVQIMPDRIRPKFAAADPFGEAEIVLDLRAGAGLAADGEALDKDRPQPL